MSLPARVIARAPAKVNLALSVGPLRADGYHDLVSVFHAVSLHDEVSALPAPDHEFSVKVTGKHADRVPTDETNLALRAARLLAEYAGVRAGARLQIRKGIPVAGGMAGGSADAAAALIACDALWGTMLGREELIRLAARLGSDVPFGLLGGTAVGTGRGEQLTAALARGTYHWVFAFSDDGLPTPEVYAELDRLRGRNPVPGPSLSGALMSALRAGDPDALGATLHNDLERAASALDPRLRFTLESGRDLGALGALVSGSGPTCAFLARDDEHALDISVGLTATGAAAEVTRAYGPVAGARIVG